MKKTFLLTALLVACSIFILNTGCVGDDVIGDPSKVKWEQVKNIDELKGTWKSETDTLIFPKMINNKEYLHIINNPTDDTTKWNVYIYKNNLTVDEAWAKRYAAISEVYGVPYPISDSNGTEQGVKVKLKNKTSKTTGTFESTLETLIPETIVDKNLSFFSLSPDKKFLRESGTFRFYSNKISNIYEEEKIYSLVQE